MKPTRTLQMLNRPRAAQLPGRQRGVIVFIALIVLVAMTLAGIAVMRSSGTAVLTAGNLALRQTATSAGDRGIEKAVEYLATKGPDYLQVSQPNEGYYSSWNEQVPALPAGDRWDPILWGKDNWQQADRAVLVETDAGGNTIRYVIHRLCATTGPVDSTQQECVKVADEAKGSMMRSLEGGERTFKGNAKVYYRITARVDGPKNTVSIIQATVY